jgi:hypothetical protein
MKIDLDVLRRWLAAHGFDVNDTTQCDIHIYTNRAVDMDVYYLLKDEHGKHFKTSDSCVARGTKTIPLNSWPCEHKEASHGG